MKVVGRASELRAFPRFVDLVADGPAAMVLEGDAGIGKTVLWLEGLRLARERGCRVLSSRAAEAETQLAYAAVGDLFGWIPVEAFAILPKPQRLALDVAMLRAESETPIERRALALAVLGVLRGLADDTPVIVAVDDLQWLDAPSAGVLQFVFRRLETERIGLLTTRRGRHGEISSGLPEAIPADRLQRLELDPLDRDSLGRLLRDRLRVPLAPPALLQLHRVSAGNPFLALEIARALERREIGLVSGEPFPVPRSLRELVRDRLEDLSRAARQTGLIVAALAQPTVERVSTAARSEDIGADGLGEALAAGIVELEGERVRFTHPLLGSIIYSEASPARRRTLHARLAALVGEGEERARHLALAASGPSTEIAATLDEAALEAVRRGAPEAAADLYEQAIRLTPAEDGRGRYRRSIGRAEALLQAGDASAARAGFAKAVEESVGRARAHALTRLAAMLVLEPDLSAALPVYEWARLEAAGDSALTAAIEFDLVWLQFFRGDRAAAAAHARRATELAQDAEDDERLAQAMVVRALVEGRGGNAEAAAFLQRAFELQETAGDAWFSNRAQFPHALFLAGEGLLDEARGVVIAEYQRALDRGDEVSLPLLLETLTIIERRAGRWDEADRYAREMQATAESGQFFPAYFTGPYALILALRGHLEEASEVAERGLAIADAGGIGSLFGGCRAVLGLIALSTGDAHACVTVLEPLSRTLTSRIEETGWFRFLADEVEARVALDELDQATELLKRLAERRGVLADAAWGRAATERCRGLLLAAAGDEEGANEAFASALAEHEDVHEPFELARTLLAKGRVERRFKRRRASRESLTAAREIFSRLGAPQWIARSDDELQRIGGRAPRQGGLTPTEERVAQLAAEGLTNREIAAAAFLSINTVQAYLKRIYRELGVRSRTELAREFTPDQSSKSTDPGVSSSSPGS